MHGQQKEKFCFTFSLFIGQRTAHKLQILLRFIKLYEIFLYSDILVRNSRHFFSFQQISVFLIFINLERFYCVSYLRQQQLLLAINDY